MEDSPLSIRLLGAWEVRVGGQPMPSVRPHSGGWLLEGCLEEWVLPERASREEACLQALERLADRSAERGELAAALGYLAQAAALDPLRDSTQRRRMQALTMTGDLPAALLTYRE